MKCRTLLSQTSRHLLKVKISVYLSSLATHVILSISQMCRCTSVVEHCHTVHLKCWIVYCTSFIYTDLQSVTPVSLVYHININKVGEKYFTDSRFLLRLSLQSIGLPTDFTEQHLCCFLTSKSLLLSEAGTHNNAAHMALLERKKGTTLLIWCMTV